MGAVRAAVRILRDLVYDRVRCRRCYPPQATAAVEMAPVTPPAQTEDMMVVMVVMVTEDPLHGRDVVYYIRVSGMLRARYNSTSRNRLRRMFHRARRTNTTHIQERTSTSHTMFETYMIVHNPPCCPFRARAHSGRLRRYKYTCQVYCVQHTSDMRCSSLLLPSTFFSVY